jgi:hypothetical protein
MKLPQWYDQGPVLRLTRMLTPVLEAKEYLAVK